MLANRNAIDFQKINFLKKYNNSFEDILISAEKKPSKEYLNDNNRRAYLWGGNARDAQIGRNLRGSRPDLPRESRSFGPALNQEIHWGYFP